jgi:hypothetical protein
MKPYVLIFALSVQWDRLAHIPSGGAYGEDHDDGDAMVIKCSHLEKKKEKK